MSRPQPGPPLIAPGLAFTALTIAAVIAGAQAPLPTDSAESILAYAQQHAGTMRWAAFLSLGAAVPLAIWTATVYRRLRALGVTAPGAAIALAGGLIAATMSALAGLTIWVASRATFAPMAAALRDLSFATGGPGFVAFFGLLVAGVSVPMLLLNLNRAVALFGLVIALAAEVSTLVLVNMGLSFALPIGRFGGLIWLIAVSLMLPATRPRTRGPDESPEPQSPTE